MLDVLWAELRAPARPSIDRWLAAGCVSTVRRVLIGKGWQVTTADCGEIGFTTPNGERWCVAQDPTSEPVLRPAAVEEYDPAKDALFLACERTVGANAARIAAFLVSQRNNTPTMTRNEYLTSEACKQAACCGAS